MSESFLSDGIHTDYVEESREYPHALAQER